MSLHILRFARLSCATAILAGAVACSDTSAPIMPLPNAGPLAIINGSFDGNGHPAVGALLFDFRNDGITGLD